MNRPRLHSSSSHPNVTSRKQEIRNLLLFENQRSSTALPPHWSLSASRFRPSVLESPVPSGVPSVAPPKLDSSGAHPLYHRTATGNWAIPTIVISSDPELMPHSHDFTYEPVGEADAQRLIDNFVSKSTGHIKRISNSFFCFRRDFAQYHRTNDPDQKLQQKDLSKLASTVWKTMDAKAREPYVRAYRQLKTMFDAKYPEYKYQPLLGQSKEQYELGKKLWSARRKAEIQTAKRRTKASQQYVDLEQVPAVPAIRRAPLLPTTIEARPRLSLPSSASSRATSCPPLVLSPVDEVPFISRVKRGSQGTPYRTAIFTPSVSRGFNMDDWIINY